MDGSKSSIISIHALLAESDRITIITICTVWKFLSTLSLRRATQVFQRIAKPFRISIHALLAESDCFVRCLFWVLSNISIHALLAESDRETARIAKGIPDFYPRSPCGERPQLKPPVKTHRQISIHALLAESDKRLWTILYSCPDFYPRSPCGERPYIIRHAVNLHPISIHALLAESDSLLCFMIHRL